MSRLPRSESNAALLDEQVWEAKLFSGTWRTPLAGGRNAVIEPATGECRRDPKQPHGRARSLR